MPLILRPATAGDADAIAAVFSPSFRLLTFLPILHSVAEDLSYMEHVVLRDCAVSVAEDGGRVVGFLARQGEEVRHLYVHPDAIGQGVGSLLLDAAKRSGVDALELWCFQANIRARRFYEARGFRAIRFTDGDNDEKMPDVRYRWERATDPQAASL